MWYYDLITRLSIDSNGSHAVSQPRDCQFSKSRLDLSLSFELSTFTSRYLVSIISPFMIRFNGSRLSYIVTASRYWGSHGVKTSGSFRSFNALTQMWSMHVSQLQEIYIAGLIIRNRIYAAEECVLYCSNEKMRAKPLMIPGQSPPKQYISQSTSLQPLLHRKWNANHGCLPAPYFNHRDTAPQVDTTLT